MVDRVSLLQYTPLGGLYDHPEEYGINGQMLKIENFDKMYLCEKPNNWWCDKRRLKKCDAWYGAMRNFIDENWDES